MMRQMMKSEDSVVDVDVVASLTEKLRKTDNELARERLVSQQALQRYEDGKCAICMKKVTASKDFEQGKCGCTYHGSCIKDRIEVDNSCPTCGILYEKQEKNDQ